MGWRGSHGACGWGINPAARHPLCLLEGLPGVARAWYGAHTGRGHAESTQTPPAGDTLGTSSLERAVTSPWASCEQPGLGQSCWWARGWAACPFPRSCRAIGSGAMLEGSPGGHHLCLSVPAAPGLATQPGSRAGGSSVNERWRWGGGVIFPKKPRCKRASLL